MNKLRVVGDGALLADQLFRAPAGVAELPRLQIAAPDGTNFSPIGSGKPLTVELAHVYTGKYPGTILGSSPMMITSAVKNLDQTGASAEAVNYLVPKVSRRTGFASPPADKQGTRLISYVPAVTAASTTITLNLVFENFPDGAFDEIGSVFSGTASIPIFLTQSTYLVGAGSILKLVQDIGDTIFNGRPNFTPTFTINFSDIGPATQAGYEVYFKSTDDSSFSPDNFKFVPNNGLVDKTGKPYGGDAPYFVIAIDGTQRDSLKGFAPLAATANQLATFFNIKDGGAIPVADILNVFKAKNDVDFGEQALQLKDAIAAAKKAGRDTTALEQQLTAQLANIQDSGLAKLFGS